MDARHFDDLARRLTVQTSRRHVLAAVPVVGGILALLDPEGADGLGRRKRRARRHRRREKQRQRGQDRRNHKKRGKRQDPQPTPPACTPDATAQTCAGKCGTVTNNCQQGVDCGSCVCDPPCGICLTCDAGTG